MREMSGGGLTYPGGARLLQRLPIPHPPPAPFLLSGLHHSQAEIKKGIRGSSFPSPSRPRPRQEPVGAAAPSWWSWGDPAVTYCKPGRSPTTKSTCWDPSVHCFLEQFQPAFCVSWQLQPFVHFYIIIYFFLCLRLAAYACCLRLSVIFLQLNYSSSKFLDLYRAI